MSEPFVCNINAPPYNAFLGTQAVEVYHHVDWSIKIWQEALELDAPCDMVVIPLRCNCILGFKCGITR